MQHDFLLEIGAEELPAKSLESLGKTLADNIQQGLNKEALSFAGIEFFATPRRLAVLVKQLQEQQPDRAMERRGPAIKAAYDAQNQPTPALTGFARSCGVDITQLEKQETPQGTWLIHRYTEKGKSIHELMPAIVTQAIANLPITKPMRWADTETQFARPVQWIVILYGSKIIKAEILGLTANYISHGHRFHHPQPIIITEANQYAELLEKKAYVIADFARRRNIIHQQIIQIAQTAGGTAVIDQDLLNEVTGIIEWPVALLVHFDKIFLTVPKEALISAMQHHQKSFPVVGKDQQLLPVFITISNIESLNRDEVIQGNARVMRARLSDAKFFYETDCKITLAERLPELKNIVFQAKLGSVYDKSQRISQLASYIAEKINANQQQAERAGLLAKTDLISNMVNEFPELQGIMGDYYARHDQEPTEVATAIREHYLPRFAGDVLPETTAGCALALADRLDTLVGIFGINQAPTGDKDPFGLRRAAVGILRILVEKQLNINLLELLEKAANNYPMPLPNANAVAQTFDFIYERFRAWYQEHNISADVFAAVYAKRPASPFDFALRIKAVSEFRQLPQATALIAANKRVSNLLVKENQQNLTGEIVNALLQESAEQQLTQALSEKNTQVTPLYQTANYTAALTELAGLQPVIDTFFDKVMVMVEDQKLRHNRLLLLNKLRELFLQVADISLLQ